MIDITTVELEKIKACGLAFLQESDLARYCYPDDINFDISGFSDWLENTFVVRSTIKVLCEKPTGGETVYYPADWWQAFKKQYFPAWLLKRFPVKMESVTISLDAIYPTVAFPRHHMGGFKVSRMVRSWEEKP